ncbi:MAG: argininosuccinate lyase [Actinobacteria bacterium]|nr:argininosuccinate lyase [Actinomycetota bacterium]
MSRVALAYSGGLDTSVAAAWLRREAGDEVVAVLVDLGQPFDLAEVRARAAAADVELHVVDAREEFVETACLPALFANALYEGKYPLVSALARPVIAAKLVEVARETGADTLAHGCTGKGNDQVRFVASFAALAPGLGVMAPIRERTMSRDEAVALARGWGIPLSSESKVYSVDENLWGRTVETGPLEDPWAEPPPDAFELTVDPRLAPAEPAEVVVGFEAGRPATLDGVPVLPIEAIARLNEIGGAHGFGRVDMIENRLVGIKSRELYEVPAAMALIAAHRDLEDLTLERDLAHEKAALERRWAELCYYGLWYGPLHGSLRDFMAGTQERVTGQVRLRFHRGACHVVGRRSPVALYDTSLATYEGAADRFDHRHAEGFVRLWSLPTRVWAAREAASGGPATHPAPPPAAPAPPEVGPAALQAPAAAGPSPTAGDRPLWAGRFSAEPSEDAMAFTRSISFDIRLAPHDVRATQAHARALAAAGLLSSDESDTIVAALGEIADEVAGGRFVPSPADEDVHSAIERALTDRLGELGARIHAGRSRNDLVAADLRMWTRDAAAAMAAAARSLAAALHARAAEHGGVVMPGYTHLQRAQPVPLSLHLEAHAAPLLRDAERLDRAAASANRSPLGAGALAGTTLPIDFDAVAAQLGFDGRLENSIDAVSDRDFALEFLAACTSVAVHVSRLAEDLVLWCSAEFGFARVDEAYATGSSMMPQKRNPDVAELARGKAGRVIGDLVRLATVMKGLPLAYDRDLQEDKEAVFDAHDALAPALVALTGMVSTLEFDTERMRAAVDEGFLEATRVAESLVEAGVPFRRAHEAVGELVRELESKGRGFTDLSEAEWRAWAREHGAETVGIPSPRPPAE